MLATLRIRNLALVADLTLEFPPGLVVVTGETGAGKSVILGAINLLLGERAERTLIRAGADTCSVEAVFDAAHLGEGFRACLVEQGIEPCEDGQLVLRRSFTAAGTNRQFVNGTPTTLVVLSRIGDWLVDMHGPHEHQSLLQPARQLALLDAFGGLAPRVAAFRELAARRRAIATEKAALVVDDRTYRQQLDLLRFQVHEITTAALKPGEDAVLEQDYQRAANAVRLLQLGQAGLGLLDGDDPSLSSQSAALARLLQELQRLDPATAALSELHTQAVAVFRELHTRLSRYLERIETDPAQLQALEERLNLLHALKRKYGPSLDAVIAMGDDARRRLTQLESRDAELQRLNLELTKAHRELLAHGRELTLARGELIPRLAKAAARELRDLGFRQSRLDLALTTRVPEGDATAEDVTPGATGFDALEFVFAPNPGEPARPLRAVASSGELARVMLALKTVLAAEDEIPVLVFDEVDANVGGETAQMVGAKMARIARRRQVFCVTHLPQVAAAAHAHFAVTKEIHEGRTTVRMERLDATARVTELARMLGGQSEAARQHARALLAERAEKGPEG